MKRFFTILALAMVFAAPGAASDSGRLQERFKIALNGVVTKVRQAEDPADKRALLQRFTSHMEQGLDRARGQEGLSDADRRGLASMQDRFHAYNAELNGGEGFDRVDDSGLDDFAGYMQQQMEQAPVGGGIYISAGALLIIVLLLILLF